MNIEVKIGSVNFKNPIWVASGTFGYGEEFIDFLDLDTIGAIIAKTVTLEKRQGNPPPRLAETTGGMLNSIGLANDGAENFRNKHYARLKKLNTHVIISIGGKNQEEFLKCARILCEANFPSALELNLSCPNVSSVKTNYRLIAQDPVITQSIISAVKAEFDIPIIAKLTPNVTDIAVIAKAAEAGGADAVSVVNTYLGMAVDSETKRPKLGNIVGGLSGPAIKPLALYAVRQVYQNVSIPVIGIGGIMTGTDVAEFMLCGASAVQIGTANLINPNAHAKILEEFKDYLKYKNIKHLDTLIGRLETS